MERMKTKKKTKKEINFMNPYQKLEYLITTSTPESMDIPNWRELCMFWFGYLKVLEDYKLVSDGEGTMLKLAIGMGYESALHND